MPVKKKKKGLFGTWTKKEVKEQKRINKLFFGDRGESALRTLLRNKIADNPGAATSRDLRILQRLRKKKKKK